jgi:hypothetical protein
MEWPTEAPILALMSGALILVGAVLTRVGIMREWRAIRMSAADPAKSLALMQSFRIAVIALSIAALGIGLLADQLWLIILALIIGGEEAFESTMAIGAMTRSR